MYIFNNCTGELMDISASVCNCTYVHDVPLAAVMFFGGVIFGLLIFTMIDIYYHKQEKENDP